MRFKFIDSKGSEYEKERMLRWEVLLKPLGLPPGSEGLPRDEDCLHLIAIENKKVIGCICFSAESKTLGEIFHMAVSEEYQGKGFGRKLMHTMENALFEKGVRTLYVYAFQDIEGFYAKMGYHAQGDCIKRNGAFCRLMKKTLSSPETHCE